MQRHTIYFTGDVQGVGFRVAAQKFAKKYNVSGFVQNLDDGRVLLVTEGFLGPIGYLLIDLQSEFLEHIERIEILCNRPRQYEGFEIRGLTEEEQA